eukprot:m.128136 g.128136  ORF g.128136 m.128136 type:complete len:747 (+) comp16725_c0_seq8:101-2341(+)
MAAEKDHELRLQLLGDSNCDSHDNHDGSLPVAATPHQPTAAVEAVSLPDPRGGKKKALFKRAVDEPGARYSSGLAGRTNALHQCIPSLRGGYSWNKLYLFFPRLYRNMWKTRGVAFFCFIYLLTAVGALVPLVNSLALADVQCLQDICGKQPGWALDSRFSKCAIASKAAVCDFVVTSSSVTRGSGALNNSILIDGMPCEQQCPTAQDSPRTCGVVSTDDPHYSVVLCVYPCASLDGVCPTGPITSKNMGEVILFIVFVVLMLVSSSVLGYICLHLRKFTPLLPAELVATLFKAQPLGTFMVSYSWGGDSGEYNSTTLVQMIVPWIPCCWWDRERLWPGTPVLKSCLEAARACKVALVFISNSYLRSDICQQELATLRQTETLLIVFLMADTAETKAGASLASELLHEGHDVFVVKFYPFSYLPSSLLHWLKNRGYDVSRWQTPRWVVQHEQGGVFESLDATLILQLLVRNKQLRSLLAEQTPPVNEYWRPTAAIVSNISTTTGLLWLVRAPITSSGLSYIFTYEGSNARFTTVCGLALLVCLLSVMFSNIVCASNKRFNKLPHVAHFLLVMHRCGLVESTITSQHVVDVRRKQRCSKTRPAPSCLAPFPIAVPGLPLKRFELLESLELIVCVPEGSPAVLRLLCVDDVELASHDEYAAQNVLFWSTKRFDQLHPSTQAALGGGIVATEQQPGGPDLESILCQLLLAVMQTTPKSVSKGPHKWCGKQRLAQREGVRRRGGKFVLPL